MKWLQRIVALQLAGRLLHEIGQQYKFIHLLMLTYVYYNSSCSCIFKMAASKLRAKHSRHLS